MLKGFSLLSESVSKCRQKMSLGANLQTLCGNYSRETLHENGFKIVRVLAVCSDRQKI